MLLPRSKTGNTQESTLWGSKVWFHSVISNWLFQYSQATSSPGRSIKIMQQVHTYVAPLLTYSRVIVNPSCFLACFCQFGFPNGALNHPVRSEKSLVRLYQGGRVICMYVRLLTRALPFRKLSTPRSVPVRRVEIMYFYVMGIHILFRIFKILRQDKRAASRSWITGQNALSHRFCN